MAIVHHSTAGCVAAPELMADSTSGDTGPEGTAASADVDESALGSGGEVHSDYEIPNPLLEASREKVGRPSSDALSPAITYASGVCQN